MKTVRLDKAKHDKNQFNCEITALNNYFKAMVQVNRQKRITQEHLYLKIVATIHR
ncbi:MAG: hypothetical protein ACI9LM_004627 [Alteromonadaceae bacterium]|jgi:hypothetical protein